MATVAGGAQRIAIPKIEDLRGNLSFLQQHPKLPNQTAQQHRAVVPFSIQRTYWIYDVPGGQFRGSHAFRTTAEVIVALSGSFDVVLHDGHRESVHSLNRSYDGLYVPAMLWRTLSNFSTNSVALILASTPYHESDYIRDFSEFQREQAEIIRAAERG